MTAGLSFVHRFSSTCWQLVWVTNCNNEQHNGCLRSFICKVCARISRFVVFTNSHFSYQPHQLEGQIHHNWSGQIHHTNWCARATRSTPVVLLTCNFSNREIREQTSYNDAHTRLVSLTRSFTLQTVVNCAHTHRQLQQRVPRFSSVM